MVIDLIFVGALLVCALLLISGRPLNICVTHTHRVEEQPKTEPHTEQENEEQDKSKEISEFLQDFLGVLNENE